MTGLMRRRPTPPDAPHRPCTAPRSPKGGRGFFTLTASRPRQLHRSRGSRPRACRRGCACSRSACLSYGASHSRRPAPKARVAAVRLFLCRHLRAPLRGRGQPPHLRRAALWRRKRRLRAKEEPPLPRVARRSRAALCAPYGACPSAFSRHSAACGRLRALRLSLRGGAGCPAPCPFGGLGCAAPLWSCACGGARLRLSVLAWAGALRPSAAAVRLVPRRSVRVGGLCPRTCSPRAAPLLAWSWSVCVTGACDGRSPPRLFPAPLGVGRGAPSPSAVPLCSACRVGGFPVPVVRGAALPSPSLRGVAALWAFAPPAFVPPRSSAAGAVGCCCVLLFRRSVAGLLPLPLPSPSPFGGGGGDRPAASLRRDGGCFARRVAPRRTADKKSAAKAAQKPSARGGAP